MNINSPQHQSSQPKVSIIVAIYNSERSLANSLGSIIQQTYQNLEILLVDDGSKDGSGDLCDEYAAIDSRIRVFHQTNGGVSVARQTGLSNATGDYIIHVDADDWIEKEMVSDLVEKIQADHSDMVICDYIEDSLSASSYHSLNLDSCPDKKVLMEKILRKELAGFCVNKFIRREKCQGIDFKPSFICYREDELFNLRVLSQDLSISYLPKAYYHYNIDNPFSLSNSSRKKTYPMLQYLIDEYINIAKQNGISEDCLYVRKRELLSNAFILRRFSDLRNYFPEIREHIIAEGRPYIWQSPRPFYLSMALKGFPHIASLLYSINMRLTDLTNSMKNSAPKH